MSAKRTDHKGRVLRVGESQRKDLTYMYRYTDYLGKRRCVYAPTLTELRNKEKEVVVAESQGVQAFDNITLDELMARYEKMSVNKKKTTQHHYAFCRQTVQRYLNADKPIRNIKMSEAKLWLLSLIDSGLSASTTRTIGRYLKRIAQIAVDDDVIAKNPFSFQLSFLPEANKRQAMTEDQQAKFLELIRDDWTIAFYLDHVVFMLETGVRLGEFLGLTKADFDLENRRVSITHQLKGKYTNELYIETPKSKSGNRAIPLSDKAYRAAVRLIQRSERFGCKTVIDGHTDFIAISKQGTLMTLHTFDQIVYRMRQKYEERYNESVQISPHIFRHTFCTNMYHKGISATTLQYLMGHALASTTMDIYTHSDFAHAEEEFRKVSGS